MKAFGCTNCTSNHWQLQVGVTELLIRCAKCGFELTFKRLGPIADAERRAQEKKGAAK